MPAPFTGQRTPTLSALFPSARYEAKAQHRIRPIGNVSVCQVKSVLQKRKKSLATFIISPRVVEVGTEHDRLLLDTLPLGCCEMTTMEFDEVYEEIRGVLVGDLDGVEESIDAVFLPRTRDGSSSHPTRLYSRIYERAK